MKILLLLLIIFCFTDILGQTISPDKKVVENVRNQKSNIGPKITVQIYDLEDDEPIPFAILALILRSTNQAVASGMCDSNGRYVFKNIPIGNYTLEVTFSGYKKKSIDFNIRNENEHIQLDHLTLAEDIETLQEVSIEGKKSLYEEKVDRVVYNAENDESNRGGDATDVLRKAPMIAVDMNGNVSLRGSQKITVLINNKPSSILAGSVAEALQQISADDIKFVEVITSPSSKYDAEGSSGIINIVTKKNTRQGFSANLNGSAGWRSSSGGITSSYWKGKMGITAGISGRKGYNIHGKYDNYQVTSIPNLTRVNTQHGITRNHTASGRYSVGLDFDISPRDFINMSFRYSNRNNLYNQDSLINLRYQNDVLIRTSKRKVLTTDLGNTIDANISYTHQFKKPQKEFSLLALYSKNSKKNDYTSNLFGPVDFLNTYRRLKNLNATNNSDLIIEADFQTPVGKDKLLETGVKNTLRHAISDYSYFVAKGADSIFIPRTDSTFNNTFAYNQNITGAYITYAQNFLKTYKIKAGLRYEYTNINANFQSNRGTVVNIPSYFVFVPGIHIYKKITGATSVKLSFSRRLQRPSMQYLNPNINASNPLNSKAGNPNLKPEYSNNYELNLNTQHRLGSTFISFFMKNTQNAIQTVRFIRGRNSIRQTYTNIDQENIYGVNLYSTLELTKNLSLNGGLDVYYISLKNNDTNLYYRGQNMGWVPGGRISANYKLSKTLGIQLFGFYHGKEIQLQGLQGGYYTYSGTIRKDINDRKGSITLGFENFTKSFILVTNTLNTPEIQQINTNTLYNFNFKISFNYRIGIKDQPLKSKTKKITNDDAVEKPDTNISNGEIPSTPLPAAPAEK